MQNEIFGITAGKGMIWVTVNETITSIHVLKGKDLFEAFKASPHWPQGQHNILNRVKDMMAENAKPKVWEL